MTAAVSKPGVTLTAELIARAIVAAAISYGDDPLEAVGKACHKRRALTACVLGLARATGAAQKRIADILGVRSTSVFHARGANKPGFWKAALAAEAAAREHLKAHPPVACAPTAATPARRKGTAAQAARPLPPRLPSAAPSAAPRGPGKPAAPPPAEAGVQRAADIFDAFRRPAPPPSPHAREPMERLPQGAAVTAPSIHSGSRTVGKPAPRKAGAGQGAGGDPQEFAFVSRKRAARVPWSAISAMTGVAETTLRKRYDPTFVGVGA